MNTSSKTVEVNYDGLVGPTHNYAGLSLGNEASTSNEGEVSNPRAAALQGLAKMRHMHSLGLVQGVIPPHERPAMHVLRNMGFEGDDREVLDAAYQFSPKLLARVSSASSMWVANAATVSPSADTADARIHFTPANLSSLFHRSIEPEQTGAILKRLFDDDTHFAHHEALPSSHMLGDEGAANHMRLCRAHGVRGTEVFVWGRESLRRDTPTSRFPARQSLEASRLVARAHELRADRVVFVQQNPEVIDAGVFHNDVISVANEDVLFAHEDAFVGGMQSFDRIEGLRAVVVPRDRVSVEDAVASYLFNSQLVTHDGSMRLIAPAECSENEAVSSYLDEVIGASAIAAVDFMNLRESMRNGGGPACLRLRVVMTDDELSAANRACLMDETRISALEDWVTRHYRDRLTGDDLCDPQLLTESRQALDDLTRLLDLGSIYPFQRAIS